MNSHRRHSRLPNWAIPSIYAVVAFATGVTFPRFEPRLLPQIESGLSTTAAVAIYSSVGTGILALTGIVFSLVFVMLQFSAVAYFAAAGSIDCARQGYLALPASFYRNLYLFHGSNRLAGSR